MQFWMMQLYSHASVMACWYMSVCVWNLRWLTIINYNKWSKYRTSWKSVEVRNKVRTFPVANLPTTLSGLAFVGVRSTQFEASLASLYRQTVKSFRAKQIQTKIANYSKLLWSLNLMKPGSKHQALPLLPLIVVQYVCNNMPVSSCIYDYLCIFSMYLCVHPRVHQFGEPTCFSRSWKMRRTLLCTFFSCSPERAHEMTRDAATVPETHQTS